MKTKSCFIVLSLIVGLLFVDQVFAANTSYSLGTIANNMTFSAGGLSRFINAACFIAGFGFAVGAAIKYKAHRDNPTQVTLGQSLLLAFVALLLVFMPFVFGAAGATIFGPGVKAGGAAGVSTF